MRTWITLLVTFLAFLYPWSAAAQNGRWDSALDKYDDICGRCIDLRQRSLSGEAIQASEIADLLSQVSSLRAALQEASGQMTTSQRARFESIRLRYSEVFSDSSTTPSITGKALGLPPGPPDLTAISQAITEVSPASLIIQDTPLPARPEVKVKDRSLHFGMLGYGTLPRLQPGLMLRVDAGSLGFYAKGALPILPQSTYDCFSDGTTESGFIWTSGRERTGFTYLSAGADYAVLARKGFDIRIYAGGGTGRKSVLWEDASGRWARVSDLSVTGLSADAGLLLDLGHFSLMAGVSTLSFADFLIETGLGFTF